MVIRTRKSVPKFGFTPTDWENSKGHFCENYVLYDYVTDWFTGQYIIVHIDGWIYNLTTGDSLPVGHSLGYCTVPEVKEKTCISWTVATGRGCLWS